MTIYILRRVLWMVPSLLIVFTLTFLVVHATPGGPWDESEKPLPEAVKANLDRQYHLNDPLHKQYVDYLVNALHGDFGPSYRSVERSVTAVVMRHAMKNALIPVVTVAGVTLTNVITGAFFIERIYGVPGIGRQFVDSVTGRDYPLLLGIVLLFALLISVMNLLVDISYALIDPRIRYR